MSILWVKFQLLYHIYITFILSRIIKGDGMLSEKCVEIPGFISTTHQAVWILACKLTSEPQFPQLYQEDGGS